MPQPQIALDRRGRFIGEPGAEQAQVHDDHAAAEQGEADQVDRAERRIQIAEIGEGWILADAGDEVCGAWEEFREFH
jgi:hypothetical protein